MVFLQEKKVWLDKMRRNRKKKKVSKYPVRCIILLSVEPQERIDYVEKKENKQLRYIEEYAKANNLIPMKILRKGMLGASGKRALLGNAIKLLEKGVAEAILVANMESISYGVADAYMRVGIVKEHGYRVFSVDEGELGLKLYQQTVNASMEEVRHG